VTDRERDKERDRQRKREWQTDRERDIQRERDVWFMSSFGYCNQKWLGPKQSY
jgi:hypothetical protein